MTDDPILTPRAFPSHGEWLYSGMTLRDWFAGQALFGLLAHDVAMVGVAKMAYAYADAMLEVRAKL